MHSQSTTLVHIYALCDPDTGAVRYIGQTSVSLQARLQGHLNRFRGMNRLSLKEQWLQHLAERGYEPTIRLLETVSTDQASERERTLIEEHLASGAALTNTIHNRHAPNIQRGRVLTRPRGQTLSTSPSVPLATVERSLRAEIDATKADIIATQEQIKAERGLREAAEQRERAAVTEAVKERDRARDLAQALYREQSKGFFQRLVSRRTKGVQRPPKEGTI